MKHNADVPVPRWVHVVFLFFSSQGFLIDNIPTVIASSHFSRFQDLAVSIPTSDDVHVHVSRGSEPALWA